MPDAFARLGIECVQVATNDAKSATRYARDDFALHEQGRRSDVAETLGHTLDFDIPNLVARLGVHGHEVIVLGPHVDAAITHGESSGAAETLHVPLRRPGVNVGPEQLSGCCISRVNIILHALKVAHAISNQRASLQARPQCQISWRTAGG